MKRREFLKTGAMVVVGSAVAATGLIQTANAAKRALPKLSKLTPHEAATLLRMTREIFPHKKLSDGPYWKVVVALDTAAQRGPAVAKLLADGVAHLDAVQSSKFLALDETQQVAALKNIESTPFFQKVREVELQTLYCDPSVFQAMGYQGASYSIGGYLHHGFNDLDWLDDPSEYASPKPA
jgi:hypothetical protein